MHKLFLLFLFVGILGNCVLADLGELMKEDQLRLEKLGQYKQALALSFAKQLNDQKFAGFVAECLSTRGTSQPLVKMLEEYSAGKDRSFQNLAKDVARLDKMVRKAKSIDAKLEEILEVRVAVPEKMTSGLRNLNELLVAYVPHGNEKSWTAIEAFDRQGKVHLLDVRQVPDKPVLVVGLNAREDMRAGLELLNEELRKGGIQTTVESETRAGLKVAKLDYIRINDVQEPWISGDAEMYVMVNGIAPEAEKANILALEMPYLDDSEKAYHPNQVLIVWKNYRYQAANLNLYEHDDSANYKEIAAKLTEEIGNVVPEYKAIFDIASQIIRLMPDEWFTNDDDYVDVFYTLEAAKTYTNHPGASQNAQITLVPYVIPEE